MALSVSFLTAPNCAEKAVEAMGETLAVMLLKVLLSVGRGAS